MSIGCLFTKLIHRYFTLYTCSVCIYTTCYKRSYLVFKIKISSTKEVIFPPFSICPIRKVFLFYFVRQFLIFFFFFFLRLSFFFILSLALFVSFTIYFSVSTLSFSILSSYFCNTIFFSFSLFLFFCLLPLCLPVRFQHLTALSRRIKKIRRLIPVKGLPSRLTIINYQGRRLFFVCFHNYKLFLLLPFRIMQNLHLHHVRFFHLNHLSKYQ